MIGVLPVWGSAGTTESGTRLSSDLAVQTHCPRRDANFLTAQPHRRVTGHCSLQTNRATFPCDGHPFSDYLPTLPRPAVRDSAGGPLPPNGSGPRSRPCLISTYPSPSGDRALASAISFLCRGHSPFRASKLFGRELDADGLPQDTPAGSFCLPIRILVTLWLLYTPRSPTPFAQADLLLLHLTPPTSGILSARP